MSKQSNIPQLRFKGFDGEWTQKKIGKIAELTSSKRVYLTDYVESGIPFYRGKEITELKYGLIPNDILYITESSYEDFKNKYGVPQKNDLLITAVGTLGNVLRIKDDSKFYFKDGNLIWFRKITEFSPFLEILLHVYKSEIEKTSIGSTQRALTMVELRKLNFPFPTLLEQQKIASFLSAVDEKIQQLTRKAALLEQYKKGVMQQLFSGKLRFKDENGEAYADWEEKKFFDLFKEILDFRGRTPLKIGMEWGGEILSLSANNVKNGYIDINAEGNKGSDELYQKWMGKVNLEKDDIVFTMEAPLGKALLIPDNCKYILSQRVVAFKTIPNIINQFLIQVIWSSKFQSDIEKLSTGSTAKGINQKSLKKVIVLIPSIPEQQKIAGFLSGIDEKIGVVQGELLKMQGFKKGLMQQMFV